MEQLYLRLKITYVQYQQLCDSLQGDYQTLFPYQRTLNRLFLQYFVYLMSIPETMMIYLSELVELRRCYFHKLSDFHFPFFSLLIRIGLPFDLWL